MKYFLSYRFDERQGVVWRGSRPVDITRKAAGVLRCLIERAGTTVSQDTILSCVWPDAHVQPDNIKVLVRELRRALEDDSQAPLLIRNDPGRGYAFIAPVSDVPLTTADDHEGPRPPVFVNHREDMQKLADALAGASQCRLVVVEGERGIGKTALCDAFLQYARSISAVRVCYGQCFKHAGRPEPYSPIRDALDHLARQLPSTVPALLARQAPAWLAQLPYHTSENTASAERPTPDAWRATHELGDMLEAMASDATTVMVLEDLHWGDMETIEVLRGLARRHAPLRTMIIATVTPFESTVATAALQSLTAELEPAGRCVTIRLPPLSEEHVRTYLTERFSTDSMNGIARVLHRLTGGNPLALVSATNALVEADYLVLEAAGWRSRHSPRTLESSLPERIWDILFWQFDHLDAEDRVLLETAAAIGAEFSPADVATAAGFGKTAGIARRLDVLHARGFIGRKGVGRRAAAGGDPVYRFLHPLHAEMLANRAPAFQQLRVAERRARGSGEVNRVG
jgi:predicted ATPase/DNA-binding winged helix-turn-helix (wHTH) protein